MLARASDRGLMFVRVQNLSEFVLNLTRQNLIQDLAFRILQTLWYSCVSRFVRSCVSRFVRPDSWSVRVCPVLIRPDLSLAHGGHPAA